MLWRVTELEQFNREYEVQEYAPGLLLFGSNGGGEAFAFDLRTPVRRVVSLPFVGMDLKIATLLGTSFDSFLEHLAKER